MVNKNFEFNNSSKKKKKKCQWLGKFKKFAKLVEKNLECRKSPKEKFRFPKNYRKIDRKNDHCPKKNFNAKKYSERWKSYKNIWEPPKMDKKIFVCQKSTKKIQNSGKIPKSMKIGRKKCRVPKKPC